VLTNPEVAASPLVAWESFYVIVGSSSAALTGLMFVAITLMRETKAPGVSLGVLAFNSPTVVHLCSVFVVSAVLSAPWSQMSSVALALDAMGVMGVVYGFIVLRRMRRMRHETEYRPVFEDWLWHIILPFIAYLGLVAAAMTLVRWPLESLFGVAAATMILLLASIHNAWDIVTYIALKDRDADAKPGQHGGRTRR